MHREYLIDFSKYEVYKDGTIFSKSKTRKLECQVNQYGYVLVHLCCTDGKYRKFFLHRVIYYYFNGDIPKGMHVNHIDENKLNNALSNLNLLSPKENCNHGTRNERISQSRTNNPKTSKQVAQINLETGEVIATFPSANEVQRQLSFGHDSILRCCDGGFFSKSRNKWVNTAQAYGFGWKFID